MKKIFNLLVVISLILGQFGVPGVARAAEPIAANTLSTVSTGAGALPSALSEFMGTPPALVRREIPTETPVPSVRAAIGTPVPQEILSQHSALKSSPSLRLWTDPSQVTPNASFDLHWTVSGVEYDGLALLSISLPVGILSEEKRREGEYDAVTGMFTITLAVTEAEGVLRLRADNLALGSYVIAGEVARLGISLATASLPLKANEVFLVGKEGGTIQTADGKISVGFPAGALTEDARVEIGLPSGDDAPLYSLSSLLFDIKAFGQTSGRELKTFEKEITITVDYSKLNLPQGKEADLYLYWYNPQSGGWEGVMSVVDADTHTLTALLTHFTVFNVGVNNWQATRMPTVDTFQVSQFTGSGTFSLPIEVLPGPAGLRPSLSLGYNSQTVDSATTDTQASWVGMGWSLDTGSITRDTHGTTGNIGDDTYLLSVNGVSTRIALGTDGTYHALNENFWRIKFNSAENTWTVSDKTGNTYFFGDNSSENVNSTANMAFLINDGKAFMPLTYSWNLRRARNLFGKELLYTYFQESRVLKSLVKDVEATVDTATYPEMIIYPNGQYRIWFEREARLDYPSWFATDGIYHSFESSRLKAIHVQYRNGGNWQDTRRYAFTYASDETNITNIVFPGVINWHDNVAGRTTTLLSVQEYGENNASYPAYTFEYGDGLHMTHAENGYGGAVDFSYEKWYYDTNAPKTNILEYRFGGNEERLCQSWSGSIIDCGQWKNFAVNGLAKSLEIPPIHPGGVYKISAVMSGGTVQAGLNDGMSDYFPSNGIVTLPANSRIVTPLVSGHGSLSNFTIQLLPTYYRVKSKTLSDGNGHSYAYTYNYSGAAMNDDGNSVMAQTCADSILVDCFDKEYIQQYSEFRGYASVSEIGPDGRKVTTTFLQDDIFKGRPDNIQTSFGGTLLSKTKYEYGKVTQDLGGYSGTSNLHGYWVYQTAQENSVYGNSANTTGATRSEYSYGTYGNLTTQKDYAWNGIGWTAYRKTETYFWPNAGDPYLVSLPGKTKIYDGNDTLQAITINQYDDNITHQAAPTIGKLAAVRTWVDTLSADRYSQVSYGYDEWGNRITNTVYTGFGLYDSAPTSGWQTTQTVFDPVYHTYPIETENAKFQKTTLDYDYARGLPISETDPNGATTSALYDDLGRMISLTRPLDAGAALTMSYTDAFPFTTSITQAIDASLSYTVSREYDGMGRVTKSIAGGVITDTIYDSPATTRQSQPYVLGDAIYYTTTTTDLGGRRVTVTTADGATATTITDGLQNIVTDAKGNNTATLKDVWGRAVSVTPPSGPNVAYTYDIFDRMLTATRGGLTTFIYYNHSGQKTYMDDPDMGQWTYKYDGAGSLTQQTDARGCTLNMFYDSLNRLTNKNSAGASCGTQLDITYTYDSGVNGIGRRTSMTSGSVSNLWTYDARGRVLSETVNPGTAYTTYYTYNSADLPVRMIYPDGEAVTYEYNDRMALNKVLGNSNYVTSTSYDTAGRMTARVLGNNLTQSYGYYSWDAKVSNIGQGGRLQSIKTGSLQDLAYTYDLAGNVTKIINSPAGEIQTYGYDSLNRLTSWSLNSAAPINESYTYDPDTGNLKNKAGVDFTYDTITPKHPHAVVSAGTNTYQYDSNGNMNHRSSAEGAASLDYNADGQLVNVTVNGTPTPTPTDTPPPPTATPFVDVPTGHRYKGEIEALYFKNGITGCGGGYYCPDTNVTREQVAVYLLKAKHGASYFPPPAAGIFTDVPVGNSYASWIEQLSAEGITGGCGPGVYCPSTEVTRAQLAIFLLRSKHGSGYTPPAVGAGTGFNDVATSYWAAAWIKQLGLEIPASITYLDCPQGPGNFCPDQPIKRDLMAVFIVGTFNIPLAAVQQNAFGISKTFNESLSPSELGSFYLPLPESLGTKVLAIPALLTTGATFLYDGDGHRVAQTIDGVTTYFIGNYYEVTGSAVTKYYFAGATRIAMRKYSIPQRMSVEYFLGDHLGSTSLTTDSNGVKVSEIRYKPFGEVRYTWTDSTLNATPTYSLTNYTYTGQYSNTADFGLMYYNARWYDPALGRFAQADTIIPDGVQGYDRYAYVNNSPVQYADPSGHCFEDGCIGEAILVSLVVAEVAPEVEAFVAEEGPILADEAATLVEETQPMLEQAVIEGEQVTQEAISTIGENTSRAFWSGGKLAMNAARAWAETNRAITLEMTKAGEQLGKLTSGMDWESAKPIWEAGSKEYASRALGDVHVFLTQAAANNPDSIWHVVERPVLENGDKIINIITHLID